MMDNAIIEVSRADYFLVIGTSLAVYPAAGLIHYVPRNAKKFLIDPKADSFSGCEDYKVFSEKAEAGMTKLRELIL